MATALTLHRYLRASTLLLCMALTGAAGAATPRPIDIVHYVVELTPDLSNGHIQGQMVIHFRGSESTSDIVTLNSGALVVEAVEYAGRPLRFEQVDQQLQIHLPRPVRAGRRGTLRLRYHGAPAFGLEFHPERRELYTLFSTSQWMVCIDAPDERATLDLALLLPPDLVAIGSGHRARRVAVGKGRLRHRFELKQPMPSYVYGFAAAPYTEVITQHRHGKLQLLSRQRSSEQLRRIFAHSADMLEVFGNIAGTPYRGDYAQALVAQTIGQELAGAALLSEAYGEKLLADPDALALMAHEAAHQWWGNRITCRDWGHFWLNEGMATFMAAVYLQRRIGEDAYQRQVKAWAGRVARLRNEHKDHPLIYARWDRPSADDRAVVYQKGAYALHRLRRLLGEHAFWTGISEYSRSYDGRSVTTADLQRAMESASGRDLSRFFADWAGTAAP